MTASLTLEQKLAASETRPKVLVACEDLIKGEVADKTGLSGVAIKGAFKVVRAIKPGIVRELVDAMLDEFAAALEPLHKKALENLPAGAAAGQAFEDCLRANQEQAAEALLGVTDARAQRAKNKTLQKTYGKLRKTAQTHVAAAVPNLARTLAPFV